MLSKTFWTAKRYAAAATTRRNRVRAQLFAKRLRLRALWARVDLDLQIAGDAIIGRRLRLELEPGTRAALVLGPRSVIRDDVTILLRGGGELRLGADGELRSHCLLNLRGPFVLGPGCIVSWYSVIHCGESVTFGSYVGLAERVTVADSTHYFTEPDVFFYQNTRHAPVSIGHNTSAGTRRHRHGRRPRSASTASSGPTPSSATRSLMVTSSPAASPSPASCGCRGSRRFRACRTAAVLSRSLFPEAAVSPRTPARSGRTAGPHRAWSSSAPSS